MIASLARIILACSDIEEAAARYRSLFGLEPRDPEPDRRRFRLGNVEVELAAGADERIAALVFATTEIEETARRLARRGLASSPSAWPRGIVLDVAATHGPTIFLIDAAALAGSAETTDSPGISGLDHIVIQTANPDRALALYGARLGLELTLDRTNEAWGSRLMFFRCGDLVVELARNLREPLSDAPDRLWGLSWRTHDIAATHARLRDGGFDVSEIRDGRKPGTRVFTVRETAMKIPTLIIQPVSTTASSPRARRRAT